MIKLYLTSKAYNATCGLAFNIFFLIAASAAFGLWKNGKCLETNIAILCKNNVSPVQFSLSQVMQNTIDNTYVIVQYYILIIGKK